MNELCDLVAIDICKALKLNAGIEILDIGGNNILEKGAESLAEALMENKTLRTLELGYNPIGPKGGAKAPPPSGPIAEVVWGGMGPAPAPSVFLCVP